jgi:general secretion pathway protein B
MSSILEALKKLEDEKTARLSNAGHFAGKVIKTGRRPKEQPRWLFPASMAAVAAVAVLVTYILMGGLSTRNMEDQSAVSTKPHQSAAPSAAPAPLPSLPSPVARIRALPLSPSSHVAKQAHPTNSVPRQRQAESRQADEPAQSPHSPGIPALKVTGIGWQKDNSDRLAVVNGRSVTEGAVVEGARVEEIFPDRVRFTFNDRTFEITLGKIPGDNP